MSAGKQFWLALLGMICGVAIWMLLPQPSARKAQPAGGPVETMRITAVAPINLQRGVGEFATEGPPAPPIQKAATLEVPFTRRFWVVDDGSIAERAKREAEAQAYHLIYRPIPPID